MDKSWALELGIPLVDLRDPTSIFALDGSVLAQVNCSTAPVSLTVSSNHRETISFLVFNSPDNPVVLGHP